MQKFSPPPSSETMRRTLKRKNILEVLYHYAKFGGVTPPGVLKNVEYFIYLSLTLLNGKVLENNFAQKMLKLRSSFDIVG